jgi:nucleotide-binding universal stress UspA family protein
MKTIIIPTDFSVIADNAMRFAVDMAKQIHASVLLLHVYQLPVAISEVPVVVASADELEEASEKKLAVLKDEIERSTAYKIKVHTQSKMGNVVDVIEDVSHVIQPFAIVMGTEGVGKMERLLFGSTTISTMRHLDVPVLIIPPGVGFRPVKKIGLACDLKEVMSSVPEKEIRTVVKEFNAELHVLNVDRESKVLSAETYEQSELLRNMIADMNPQYHFIDKEDIEEGLNEFADNNGIDFLIVVPRKHKLLEGLFRKHHSDELAFHAHVPVMAIHE